VQPGNHPYLWAHSSVTLTLLLPEDSWSADALPKFFMAAEAVDRNFSMWKKSLIGTLIFLVNIAVGHAEKPTMSLRTVHNFPITEIEQFYTPPAWKLIYDAPISGYVVMNATIQTDEQVHVFAQVASYPDHSRDALAKQFAARVRIAGPNVGSHLAPTADVYIIFYDSDRQAMQAVVFAKQHESASARKMARGDFYLEVIDYKNKPSSS
jgi:hypothetical protein